MRRLFLALLLASGCGVRTDLVEGDDMALAQKNVVVQLGGGLASDIADKLVPRGRVLELENSFVSQAGKLQKRPGFAALSTSIAPTGTAPNIWQLATHKGALVALSKVGAQPIYTWQPGSSRWSPPRPNYTPTRGPWSLSKHPLAAAAIGTENPDVAASGNYIAFSYDVFNSNANVEVILDSATGKMLYQLGQAGQRTRVMVLNGFFVFVYVNPADGLVHFDRWQISSLASSGTPTSVASNAGTNVHATTPFMDVIAAGADTITVAYLRTDNTVWTIDYTVSTATAGAHAQFKDAAAANVAASQCLGFAVDTGATGQRILLVADGAAGVKGHLLATSSTTTTSTVIDATATVSVRNVTGVTVTSANYNVLWEVTGAAPWQTLVKAGRNVAGTVTLGTFNRGVGLRSRPWLGSDSTVYVTTTKDSTTQPTYWAHPVPTNPIANGDQAPVARMLTWKGNGKTEKQGFLTSMISFGTGAMVPLVQRTRLESQANVIYFDVGLSLMKLGYNDVLGRPRESADSLFVPGGVLMAFDGNEYHESDWHEYPEAVAGTSANVGGSGLVAGSVYNYIAVYRWIDASGRVRHSNVSAAMVHTVSVGNNAVNVVIPSARVNSLGTFSWYVELYRTIASGTAYYRVATSSGSTHFDSVTIQDTVSDANLPSGELLYTSGGVLPAQPPPAAFAIEQFDQRLWAIDAEDRSLVRFTTQFVDTEAPKWNEALTIRLNTQFGDATGIVAMDDKLLIFFRNAIYYISGVGPNASGVGSYNPPALIATGTGMAEAQAQSLIYTGTDVMFLSDVGIQSIDRGLNITDRGAPVQRYTDAGVTVTGAILVPDVSQIRFFTTGGTTLVWDYLHKVWSVSTGQVSATAAMWAQTPVYAATNAVLAEGAAFTENGVAYAQKITSPHLALAGLDGYFRTYLIHGIGEWLSTHTLGLTIYYDYSPTPADTASIVPDSLWTWEYANAQKASAVRVTLSDGACTGAGFSVEALSFLIGVKEGLRKIPDAKRAQ